jgi:hypothetical protein
MRPAHPSISNTAPSPQHHYIIHKPREECSTAHRESFKPSFGRIKKKLLRLFHSTGSRLLVLSPAFL